MTLSYDVLCHDLAFPEFNWAELYSVSVDRDNHMTSQIMLHLYSKNPRSMMVSPVRITVTNSHKFHIFESLPINVPVTLHFSKSEEQLSKDSAGHLLVTCQQQLVDRLPTT